MLWGERRFQRSPASVNVPDSWQEAGSVQSHGEPARVHPLAVVIVTYASATVVPDCLATLPAALARAGDARVVVVDNASPDDTVDLVKAVAPSVEVIRRNTNGGFAAGVNAGIAAAAGCDVLVLNPDIRLSPGSVAALRAALATPGVGIAVPRLITAAGILQHSLRRRPTVLRAFGEALLGGSRAGRFPALGEVMTHPRDYEHACPVDWASGAAWLISRDCLDALGELDERYFLYSEETEYMIRAGDRGFAVRYEPAAVAVHLGGELESSPWLWSMQATNRVRLHRQRHGRAASMLMWWAIMVNEAVRAVGADRAGRARHRAALWALLWMRRWPRRPAEQVDVPDVTASNPGYLCFSAQDWWYHNQAHSDFQLMRNVARHRKVLFVNSIGIRMPKPGRSTQFWRRILRKARSVSKLVRQPVPELPGFYVMTPVVLPFYGRPRLRQLNALLVRWQIRAVCSALRLGVPVVVATIPTAWDVVRPMQRRSLLFNHSDRHSAFLDSDQVTIEALERQLLIHSDHVLYVSHALRDDDRRLTAGRAQFLDHGVDLPHFRRRPDSELPRDVREVPVPRVGFFGSLDDYLVDFDLLERVAAELLDVSLVLIGDASCSMERFEKYPNVHWLGFRPYQQIPAYGSAFDVALMPWLDNEWIKYCNPIKLKEYLALGLPVVSTAFAEVEHYRDRVRVATDPAEFIQMVQRTLIDGGLLTPDERRASVRSASWEARAQQLMDLAEGRT